MKNYLLSIQQPDGPTPPPEVVEPIVRDLAVLNEEFRASGAWVFAGALREAGAAAVARPGKGEVIVTDGPYVEGKEHVGGLSIIQAENLDAALGWARKLARATTLPVEVREFEGVMDDQTDCASG